MNYRLLILLSLFVFISCKSDEDKANELIKQDLFESLIDFDSYEPVKTTIEPLVSNKYQDTIMINYYLAIKATESLLDKTRKDFEYAKKEMDIWNGGYYSDYKAKKYREAYDKAYNILAKGGVYINIFNETTDSIKSHSVKLKGEQVGWLVKHRFRCKTRGGQYSLNDYIYYMDSELTRIIKSYNVEDIDFEDVKKTIDNCINSTNKLELSDI